MSLPTAIPKPCLLTLIKTPKVLDGCISTWAQYTVENAKVATKIMAKIKAQNVPVAAYYPMPVHRQTAYTNYPVAPNGLPVTEQIMNTVFSLPMHAYLSPSRSRQNHRRRFILIGLFYFAVNFVY